VLNLASRRAEAARSRDAFVSAHLPIRRRTC